MRKNIALSYCLATEMDLPIEGTIIICNCPKDMITSIQAAVTTTACWFTTSVSVGHDIFTYVGDNFHIELKICTTISKEEMDIIKNTTDMIRSTIEIVEYNHEDVESYRKDLDEDTRKALDEATQDFSNIILDREKD